jgi:DNA repair exonuclease SbcCD ATPase subunit
MREKFTKALPYIITAAAITWMMAFGIMLMTDNKDTRDRLKQITKDVQDIKDSFEAYKTINEAELESIKADLKAVKENGETYTKQIEGVSKSLDSLKLDIVNKVKELNEKIRSVEEAKVEKKAAEQAVITTSYEPTPAYNPPTGGCLTPSGGVHNGPSGLETY